MRSGSSAGGGTVRSGASVGGGLEKSGKTNLPFSSII